MAIGKANQSVCFRPSFCETAKMRRKQSTPCTCPSHVKCGHKKPDRSLAQQAARREYLKLCLSLTNQNCFHAIPAAPLHGHAGMATTLFVTKTQARGYCKVKPIMQPRFILLRLLHVPALSHATAKQAQKQIVQNLQFVLQLHASMSAITSVCLSAGIVLTANTS